MKAARFFSICEIVCFVGLALSYIGYASQSLEALSKYFVLGMFLFSLLILLLSVCNLIAAARVKKRLNDPAIRSTIWKLVVSMKLIAIPMFLVNFLYGIIYGVFSVIFVFTAPIVLMEILVAWFAMMASSGYCIALILTRAGRAKSAPEPQSCRSFPSLFTLLMLSACFSFARR